MGLRLLTEAKKGRRNVVLKDGRQNECFLYKFQPIPPPPKKKKKLAMQKKEYVISEQVPANGGGQSLK